MTCSPIKIRNKSQVNELLVHLSAGYQIMYKVTESNVSIGHGTVHSLASLFVLVSSCEDSLLTIPVAKRT